MIDGWVRQKIEPFLSRLAEPLSARRIPPNAITLAGLGLALAAAFAIAFESWIAGLALILASRFCDGLDGLVARMSGTSTDLGGYLDIVFDFMFYGAIPLAFAIADPQANALAAAALLFSFYVNGASFLAYSILAEKQRMRSEKRGAKAFYFSTGIAEGGETLAFFMAFCLLPGHFPSMAWTFAVLCLLTAAQRIYGAIRTL